MKKMTRKQAENVMVSYILSKYGNSLYGPYNSWSDEKQKAFENCNKIADRYDGENRKIVSRNGWIFTYGFDGYIDGKKALFYITPSTTYYWTYEV